MVFDDLLLTGPDSEIQSFLKTLAEVLQLKHVTKLQRDAPLIFLGRQTECYNDHIVTSMTKEYNNTLLQLYSIQEEYELLSTRGNKRPPTEEESSWKATLQKPNMHDQKIS
eukprot:347538-Amphidinium_carterae.1